MEKNGVGQLEQIAERQELKSISIVLNGTDSFGYYGCHYGYNSYGYYSKNTLC